MTGQHLDGVITELGQLQTRGHGHVRGQNPGAAGIGDNGHPIAVGNLSDHFTQWTFLFTGKGIGKIKQIVDGVDPNDAGLFENGVIHRFRTGQGTGMGCSGLGTGGGAPRLDGQYRCGPVTRGYLFDGFDEFGPASQLFQVNHDDFGIQIFMQIAQQVQFIHICLVADGNKL